MNSVIVIGKNYSSTLGLIRSLGEAGYEVRLLALQKRVFEIAAKSRYVKKALYVEIDFFERETEEEELRALEELRGNDDRILVIPCRDITCMMLERNWDRLSGHFYIPNINDLPGELDRFSDKFIQEELARACGIPTPDGKIYDTDERGIMQSLSEVEYPCFMKPLSSSKSEGEKRHLLLCHHAEELQAGMEKARIKGKCQQVLIERYLPVDQELSAYGVAANGKVFIPACMRAIRDGFGGHRGVAAEGEVVSSSILGDLKPKLEEFVRRSGLNGLFCIDLLECGGERFFLEMNLRMGGSCYAVTMAGANLPAALADMIYHNSDEGPEDIVASVCFESELIDIDNYIKGFISYRDMKRHLAGGQAHFIQSDEDPEPWNALKKKCRVWIAKKGLRKIKRRIKIK